jgi:hypothetical protein
MKANDSNWKFPLGRLALAAAFVLPPIAAYQSHAAEPFWRQVMPRKRVEADPNADYTLVEKNGPWLIMAASFSGDSGEQEARDLVRELRGDFNLPAYYYAMTFQIEEKGLTGGLDDYGAPIKRRYLRGSRVLEHAVLVGDFPRIDDPEAQSLLDRVKTLEPASLRVDDGETTSQSLIAVRQFHRALAQRLGKPAPGGPMSHAFLTRNPLVPKEYFAPPGVEEEVAKWNKDFEYSLLKCPGKYTVKVATFRGRSTLKATDAELEKASRVRRAEESDPLVVAVDNAHKLTVALRSKGWDAYEFHDRFESYVAIGSFDEAQRLADGRLAPGTRDAQIVVNTFGAAMPSAGFEKPAYKEMGVRQADAAKVDMKEELIKQQFNSRFSKGLGDVAEGFHPKRFVGLPFDIQPQVIEAPKQSISSAYVRN